MKNLLNLFCAAILILNAAGNAVAADAKYLDLSSLATHDGVEKLGKSYANLPRGQILISVRNNTPFIVRQNANNKVFILGAGGFLPNMPEVVNIPVQDYASKIHFFGQMHFEVPNNRIIGKYVINFDDGNSIDILLDTDRISAQWNTDDHCCNWRQKDLPKATLAWEDSTQAEKRTLLREFVWQNPAPNKKITSIDFVSFKTSASPVLAAITYYPAELTTSCDTPTIKNNLDIQIPFANYQSPLGNVKLRANLEYAGQSNGQLLWRLKDYAQLN